MTTDLGAMIRAARNAEGLSLQQLAERVKRNASQVSRWESNLSRPSGDAVQRVIDVLGIDPDVLYRMLAEPQVVTVPQLDVRAAIRADPELQPEVKSQLIGLYNLLKRVRPALDDSAANELSAGRSRDELSPIEEEALTAGEQALAEAEGSVDATSATGHTRGT